MENIPSAVLQAVSRQPVDGTHLSELGVVTCTHCDHHLSNGSHRPRLNWVNAVPGLDRFYLNGPFSSRWRRVRRRTAMKMFEELGLNFEKQGRVK